MERKMQDGFRDSRNLKAWISISTFQFLASPWVSLACYIEVCTVVIYIKLALLIHADNYIVYHANKFVEIKSNQTCLLNLWRDALSTNSLSFVCPPPAICLNTIDYQQPSPKWSLGVKCKAKQKFSWIQLWAHSHFFERDQSLLIKWLILVDPLANDFMDG